MTTPHFIAVAMLLTIIASAGAIEEADDQMTNQRAHSTDAEPGADKEDRKAVKIDSKKVIRTLRDENRLDISLPEFDVIATLSPRVFYDPNQDTYAVDRPKWAEQPVLVYEGPAEDDPNSFISAVVLDKKISVSAQYSDKTFSIEPVGYAYTDDGNDYFLGLVNLPSTGYFATIDSAFATLGDPCTGSTNIRVWPMYDEEFDAETTDAIAAAWGIVNGIAPLMDTACVDLSVAATPYYIVTGDAECEILAADVAYYQTTIGIGDVALLMTGQDMYGIKSDGSLNYGVAGCGFQEGCCAPQSASAAAVMEAPVSSYMHRMVGAHELGHTLSGTHEGSINWDPDNGRKDCPSTTGVKCTIMSATIRASGYMSEHFSYGNTRAIASYAKAQKGDI